MGIYIGTHCNISETECVKSKTMVQRITFNLDNKSLISLVSSVRNAFHKSNQNQSSSVKALHLKLKGGGFDTEL